MIQTAKWQPPQDLFAVAVAVDMTTLLKPLPGTAIPDTAPSDPTLNANSVISLLLSVFHPLAAVALIPATDSVTALVPELMIFTAMLPSIFRKAVDLRLLPPETPTRMALGRMVRLYRCCSPR